MHHHPILDPPLNFCESMAELNFKGLSLDVNFSPYLIYTSVYMVENLLSWILLHLATHWSFHGVLGGAISWRHQWRRAWWRHSRIETLNVMHKYQSLTICYAEIKKSCRKWLSDSKTSIADIFLHDMKYQIILQALIS